MYNVYLYNKILCHILDIIYHLNDSAIGNDDSNTNRGDQYHGNNDRDKNAAWDPRNISYDHGIQYVLYGNPPSCNIHVYHVQDVGSRYNYNYSNERWSD